MKGSVTIAIGGELESRATGGVVVSADGVKDYVLGKDQETINAEVAGAIADIELGQLATEPSWDDDSYDDMPELNG